MNPVGVRLDSVPTGGQALSPTQGQPSETWWSVVVPSLAQPTLRSKCLSGDSQMSAGLSPLPCHLQTQTSGRPLEMGVSPSETGSSGFSTALPRVRDRSGSPSSSAQPQAEGIAAHVSVLIAAASPTDPKATPWGHAEQGGVCLFACFWTHGSFFHIMQGLPSHLEFPLFQN